MLFMPEVTIPISLHCSVGNTKATIQIPASDGLCDGTEGTIQAPCNNCQHWTKEGIRRERKLIEKEEGVKSEVPEDQAHVLKVLLVDRARFDRNVKSKIVVATCTPRWI